MKCAELLRPITLELGGKSAGIVLDDADIPATINSLKLLSFRNSGQICTLKTRILVSKKREAEFVGALGEMVRSMPVGDPNNPETHIGPMVSQKQRENVERYIDIGIKEGCKIVAGGLGRPEGLNHGWFVQPTLFAGVEPDSRIAQEEIFGPVLTVLPYEDEDQAVEIANNSIYGLSGTVFSTDIEKAVAIADRVKTGVLEINGAPFGFHAPFGEHQTVRHRPRKRLGRLRTLCRIEVNWSTEGVCRSPRLKGGTKPPVTSSLRPKDEQRCRRPSFVSHCIGWRVPWREHLRRKPGLDSLGQGKCRDRLHSRTLTYQTGTLLPW